MTAGHSIASPTFDSEKTVVVDRRSAGQRSIDGKKESRPDPVSFHGGSLPHVLESHRVTEDLKSDVQQGLEDGEVRLRLDKYGPNILKVGEPASQPAFLAP